MPGVVFEVRVLTLARDPCPKPCGSCLLKLHTEQESGLWELGQKLPCEQLARSFLDFISPL